MSRRCSTCASATAQCFNRKMLSFTCGCHQCGSQTLRRELSSRAGWDRANYGGSRRAAVCGANDGLLSNFSLIMGIAGANAEPRFVLLAGIAGLLAGASSMAAGEFVSVQSQRELYEQQIAIEREELEMAPEEEIEELSLIYQAKGIPRSEAEELAKRI